MIHRRRHWESSSSSRRTASIPPSQPMYLSCRSCFNPQTIIPSMADRRKTTTARSADCRRSSSSTLSPASSPPPTSAFTQQFADIVRRYKYHCQHIQRLLKETEKSYNEINETRVLIPGQIDLIGAREVQRRLSFQNEWHAFNLAHRIAIISSHWELDL